MYSTAIHLPHDREQKIEYLVHLFGPIQESPRHNQESD